MPLPALADSLDAVLEAARPWYVETGDGRFRLDVEGAGDPAVEPDGRSGDPAGEDTAPAMSGPPARSETELASLRASLAQRILTADATAAIRSADGIPELLLPVVLPRLRLAETPEGHAVQVIGDGHNDGDGGQAGRGLEDLIGRLRASPVYGRAFAPLGTAGTGAPATGHGGGRAQTVSIADQDGLDRNVAAIAAGRVRVTAD